jgi:hypothetical protein
MPAAQQIFFWYFDEPPPAPGYSCPLDSFRELTIPTSPEVTYGGDYLNQAPPTDYSALFNYTSVGPTLHGLCWVLMGDRTPPQTDSNELHVEVVDPLTTKANTLYFESYGAVDFEVDVILADGTTANNYYTGRIDLVFDWTRSKIGGVHSVYIKRMRFKGGPTSIGRSFVMNVKTYCSQPPDFAPMDQLPLRVIPYDIPATVTVSAPATLSTTNSYYDYLGVEQPAAYYPEDNDGASEYGDVFVLGNAADAVKTLTITVNNTSVTKYDGLSFESNGAVRIEVWDEYDSLAGAPTYTYNRTTPIIASLMGQWKHYRSWPLVHPPVGTHGNIKRVRLTAIDGTTGSTTLTNNHPLPSIWAFELFPVNSVSPRTDVGSITFY